MSLVKKTWNYAGKECDVISVRDVSGVLRFLTNHFAFILEYDKNSLNQAMNLNVKHENIR